MYVSHCNVQCYEKLINRGRAFTVCFFISSIKKNSLLFQIIDHINIKNNSQFYKLEYQEQITSNKHITRKWVHY